MVDSVKTYKSVDRFTLASLNISAAENVEMLVASVLLSVFASVLENDECKSFVLMRDYTAGDVCLWTH